MSEYFALVDELARTLSADKMDLAVELANIPDQIRGFGHVKERNVELALKRRTELYKAYRDPSVKEVRRTVTNNAR